MTTLNLQVASGDDDAHEYGNNTNFNLTSSAPDISAHLTPGNERLAGFRFESVTIPNAALVDLAEWTPYVAITAWDDPDITIHCEDVDDSVDFVTTADVAERARTSSSTVWLAIGTGAGFRTAPAITSAVQQVVNRGGWASGQAIMVIGKGTNDSAQVFRVRSYEWGSAQAAKLDIDYTVAAPVADEFGAVGEAVGAMHIRRARIVSY